MRDENAGCFSLCKLRIDLGCQLFPELNQPTLQQSGLGSFLQAPLISRASSKLKPLSLAALDRFWAWNQRHKIKTYNTSCFKTLLATKTYINFNTSSLSCSNLCFTDTCTIYLSSNWTFEKLHQVTSQGPSFIREDVLNLSTKQIKMRWNICAQTL